MRTMLTLYRSRLENATVHYDKNGTRRASLSHYFIPFIYCGGYFGMETMRGFSLGSREIKGGKQIGIILCSEKGSKVMINTKRDMWVCMRLKKRGWE